MQRKPERATGKEAEAPVLVEARDLEVHFPLRGTFVDRLLGRAVGAAKAVDGVSFQLRKGEVLGLVGESGSGKTTLARALLRLIDSTGGAISFAGRDITTVSERELRPFRRRMQVVFQDPHASLNPVMTIAAAVGHPLVIHGAARDARDSALQVADVLERVGLSPPEQFMGKFPSDLSGGQKQRAALARAIIMQPDLLIADEPVSMLDMSVRAKILELMIELKKMLNLTYLYITHDLATAKFFCDRIAIMYLGKIVEIGPSQAVYENPRHPYTASLLRAVPEPDPARGIPRDLPRGEVPDAVAPPLGCSFHPRCPKAFEVCGWEARDLRDLLEARWARMAEEDYEREQAMIRDLDALEGASTSATLTAGAGYRGSDLAELFQSIRSENLDEPLFRGVRSIDADEGEARVRFREHIDPRLVPQDEVDVACHLYDRDALDRAAAERSGWSTGA